MAAAALNSLPTLLGSQHACARRVADHRPPFVHFAAQVLVGAIQAAGVQSLIRVLARVRLLLRLIQDVFRALSFDYLALHFLNIKEPQIHGLLHHGIVAAQPQVLHLRTLLVKAMRGARSRQLTIRVNVDEAHGILAHARTVVLSQLLIDHQIVFQSLFPIYFILFYHRVGVHLVNARAVQHVGIRLIGRILLAQHLSLAYVGHRVAAAEADLDWCVRVDTVHVASMVASGANAIHFLLNMLLNVRIVRLSEAARAHESAAAHLLVLVHAPVNAPLVDSRRVLPRRVIRLALHFDEVRWLYHRLLLAANLVRFLRTHLLVVVAHRRGAGVGGVAAALGAVNLLLCAVVVREVVARVYLPEVGAFAAHLLVRVAQRSVDGHSIVHLAFCLLWATDMLLAREILFQVLLVVAGVLLQVHIVVHTVLLVVLHARVDARIHLLGHVVLRLVQRMFSAGVLETVVVRVVDRDVLIVVDDLDLLLHGVRVRA